MCDGQRDRSNGTLCTPSHPFTWSFRDVAPQMASLGWSHKPETTLPPTLTPTVQHTAQRGPRTNPEPAVQRVLFIRRFLTPPALQDSGCSLYLSCASLKRTTLLCGTFLVMPYHEPANCLLVRKQHIHWINTDQKTGKDPRSHTSGGLDAVNTERITRCSSSPRKRRPGCPGRRWWRW